MNQPSVNHWTLNWALQKGLSVEFHPTLKSTNAWSKSNETPLPFHLVLSDEQTQGRGRGSNVWSSRPGQGLLSTWRFKGPTPHPLSSVRLGFCLFKSLKQTWPSINFNLKAPNDIYIGLQKCAGLLVEVASESQNQGRCTIHVGLGLNTTGEPLETSTSLSAHTQLNEKDWLQFCAVFTMKL